MGVTTYLTTDLAPMPLLWVIPLALYLLSFIVAFAGPDSAAVRLAARLLADLRPAAGPGPERGVRPRVLDSAPLADVLRRSRRLPWRTGPTTPAGRQLSVLLHDHRARRTPGRSLQCDPRARCSSTGSSSIRWRSSWAACSRRARMRSRSLSDRKRAARATCAARRRLRADGAPRDQPGRPGRFGPGSARRDGRLGPGVLCRGRRRVGGPLRFALAAGAVLAASGLTQGVSGRLLHIERNFFGVVRVTEDAERTVHRLFHGSTLHGQQSLDPNRARRSLRRTSRDRGRSASSSRRIGPRLERPGTRVAIVGLGAGTLAAYARPAPALDVLRDRPGHRTDRPRSAVLHLPAGLPGRARSTSCSAMPGSACARRPTTPIA